MKTRLHITIIEPSPRKENIIDMIEKLDLSSFKNDEDLKKLFYEEQGEKFCLIPEKEFRRD
jgi:hypothetical protein